MLDKDLGLYYYVSRWYDPSLGRFIQADTIVPNTASPQGFDRYAYVNNNPLIYSDPTGHYRTKEDPSFKGGTDLLSSKIGKILAQEYFEFLDSNPQNFVPIDGFVLGGICYQTAEFANKTEYDENLLMNEPTKLFYTQLYSEYVMHQQFTPFPEEVFIEELHKAIAEGDFLGVFLMGFAGTDPIDIEEGARAVASGAASFYRSLRGFEFSGTKVSFEQTYDIFHSMVGDFYYELGNDVYLSSFVYDTIDGTDVYVRFRMTNSDLWIESPHGSGPHVNIELVYLNKTGGYSVYVDRNFGKYNIHLPIDIND